jgi:H+/Cl- antiporter ClcA
MDYVTETFDGVVNNEDLFPWLNVFIIAGVIGCVEYIPAAILGYGVSARLTWLDDLYNDYGIGVQLPSAIGTSVGLILVSACVGVLYPATKGSGIPHIIAYLSNGKMPQRGHFSIETVIGKIISVCASINSGIAIGREGPAIHIGAALARVSNKWVDKAKTWVTGKDIPFDGTIKSNVVMMGSAAGFASAFRAPIGGFMYVFCYAIVLPSFLVCDFSVSLLSIYCPLLAFSDST